MIFQQSTHDDLNTIFKLYDAAIAHQKAVSNMHWLPFDRELVTQEIQEGRQWKILVDDQVACAFVVAYQDAAIWGDKDRESSVYLHRIVTDPAFRGRNFVGAILEWAKWHGKTLGKKFVRLDTWAENLKLKEIYERNGFQFLGVVTPTDLAALPSHYSGIRLSLFEVAL
ncbi:MAG: GNAT family N-acetyltransferase [Saprospiraceae bacterium]|nr:GNAT family N-acetyltransferase [Saprospiraceae bacterium]